MENEATVETQADVVCFDAFWLVDHHAIMVDCVQTLSDKTLQNVFMYVDTNTHRPREETYLNDMYVDFTEITKRKIFLH